MVCVAGGELRGVDWGRDVVGMCCVDTPLDLLIVVLLAAFGASVGLIAPRSHVGYVSAMMRVEKNGQHTYLPARSTSSIKQPVRRTPHTLHPNPSTSLGPKESAIKGTGNALAESHLLSPPQAITTSPIAAAHYGHPHLASPNIPSRPRASLQNASLCTAAVWACPRWPWRWGV